MNKIDKLLSIDYDLFEDATTLKNDILQLLHWGLRLKGYVENDLGITAEEHAQWVLKRADLMTYMVKLAKKTLKQTENNNKYVIAEAKRLLTKSQ